MIETRRLKNLILIQTILSFVLSKKIISLAILHFEPNLTLSNCNDKYIMDKIIRFKWKTCKDCKLHFRL